jgi:hypothetical protein
LDTSGTALRPDPPSAREKHLEAELGRALSAYRRSIGKPVIERHPGLAVLARRHCQFMARNRGKFTLGSENISHFGFEERALAARRLYKLTNCAENVAGGMIPDRIARHLIDAWTASSKHSFNLQQDWDVTGFAVHVAPDGFVYASQMFANRQSARPPGAYGLENF